MQYLKSFFVQTEMEYLRSWVTREGVKPVDKNTSNRKYEATDFPKRSLTVYRCNKLLLRYVGNTVTYVSAFNYNNIQ